MPSIFSRIIAGEIPSFKVYEDEYVFAFLDINPIAYGHTLIVPKIEVDHFSDVPEPYYTAIFQAAKKLSPVLQKATGCKRVCAVFLGYEVPHCHYHLIPTDTTTDIDQSNAKPTTPEELKEIQIKILDNLKTL